LNFFEQRPTRLLRPEARFSSMAGAVFQLWIFAAIFQALLPISQPSFVSAKVPLYPSGSIPSLNQHPTIPNLHQQVGDLEASFCALRDPFSDPSFDNVRDEIQKLEKIKEQTARIMEEIENISAENAGICENMMAALETPSLRDEQHLARTQLMETFGSDHRVSIYDQRSCFLGKDPIQLSFRPKQSAVLAGAPKTGDDSEIGSSKLPSLTQAHAELGHDRTGAYYLETMFGEVKVGLISIQTAGQVLRTRGGGFFSRISESLKARERNKQLCSKAAIGDEAAVRALVKAGADPGYKVDTDAVSR